MGGSARLLRGALEAEEALDVEVGALLEARPVGVLRVNGVEAELGDFHAVAERLVPGVDPQRPSPPADLEMCRVGALGGSISSFQLYQLGDGLSGSFYRTLLACAWAARQL